MLPEFLTNLLHQVAKSEGFSNYEIDAKSGSSHGDNYVGIMTATTISGTKYLNDNHKKDEELHLICKAAPADESRKKRVKSDLVFSREIYIYSKLLPAFVKFQKGKGLNEVDSFVSFPRVYASEINRENGTYVLIMDDLRRKNYQMWPKDEVISLDHQLLVLRELGKFHAVSFAMKDQRPNEFKDYEKLEDTFVDIVLNGLFRQFMDKSFDRSADALTNPKYKQFMKNLRNTYDKKLIEYLKGPCSKEFGVIGHGDCWTNNFLFQYSDDDDAKRLKSICFLDWQITRYCPPVIDLMYNIFSATDKNLRKNHYNELLQTYYSTLSDTIRKLGSDPNRLYSYEDFQAQLRKFGETAIIFAPILLLVKIVDVKFIRPIDEYADCVAKGEDTDLIKELDDETQSKFGTLLNDIIDDLVELEYICIE